MTLRIALVGDYDPDKIAHRAIPPAIARAAAELRSEVKGEWLATREISDGGLQQLEGFAGVWCVPGSPYENTKGALAAIRFARESRLPFLGTCGGFQHALLEFAEGRWGVVAPKHQELDAGAADAVIAKLECSLINVTRTMRLAPGSKLAHAYGAHSAHEEYQCSYGLNPSYAARLNEGELRAVAWDEEGDIRAVELGDHPFFIATLFQPERAALRGVTPPLVKAFVRAAIASPH